MSQDESNLSEFSMMELFRSEVETQAAQLNNGLVTLESNPGDPRLIEPLMRAAHSIKGAARIVGLNAAVRIAHVMEDGLVAAQEGKVLLDSTAIDLLLRGVDFLSRVSRVPEDQLPGWLSTGAAELSQLETQFQALREGALKPVDPAPSGLAEITSPNDLPTPVETPQSPVPTVQPTPEPAPTAATVRTAVVEDQARAVKVTAESLNRMMGLAAESLVETRRTQGFSDRLIRLKKTHQRLEALFASLSEITQAGRQPQQHRAGYDEARSRLEDCRRELGQQIDQFDGFSRRLTNLSDRMYREVISSRMRPFADGVQGFPRMVRDLARRLARKVKFEIVGHQTAVDRDILEKLEAPLNHILRNAIDHGMEVPNDRVKAGKPAEGSLRLEARHRSGMLLVEVSDDGPGINLDRVRAKILEKHLSTPELLARMSEAELLEFLFLPGFSTAEQVTELSGRGVGLDAVQAMVHEAGGSVRVFSQFGKGTTFQLQLPITRSVIRALLVTIGGEPYAFPLARIDRAMKMPPHALKTVEGRLFFPLDGQNIGLVSAREVLEAGATATPTAICSIVVVSDRKHRYGIEVDRFLGARDLVVRPLDPRLGKVPDISSASIMEDGTPLLIIDVDDIVRSIDSLLSKGELARSDRSRPAEVQVKVKRVLVVDDSVTVREVERKLLENRGYAVDVAVDGREGWNAVRLGHYDLVISDVDMPRMTGIEFLRLIRGDPRLKDLPVMIVSYKNREEDRMRGLEAGANHYFTKGSFHDTSLITAVQDLIGASSQA